MTPEQLAEIKGRAESTVPFTKKGGSARRLAEKDVPALLAEVEQLQTLLRTAKAALDDKIAALDDKIMQNVELSDRIALLEAGVAE